MYIVVQAQASNKKKFNQINFNIKNLIKRLILISNFTKNSRFVHFNFQKKKKKIYKRGFFLFNLKCNYFIRIKKYLELKLFHYPSHRILSYIFNLNYKCSKTLII